MPEVINQHKCLRITVLILIIFCLILAFPTDIKAYDETNLVFRKVNRFDDIFLNYLKNDENNRFSCESLKKEIDYINDKIDGYKENIQESSDLNKKERYEINLKAYKSILSQYRDYEQGCTDNGLSAPLVSKYYVSKNNNYDNIKISVTDREKHPARIRYLLKEADDSSLIATLVISDKLITYPYDFSLAEKYYLNLRNEDQTIYLKNPLIFYKNYYYYLFTNFNNSDDYLTTAPPASKNKLTFSDIDESNKYFNSINLATERGFIIGYPDGSFKPNEFIKRKEFLKITFEALNLTTNGDESDLPFDDLKNETWAVPYIRTAISKGIINPKNKNFFPNQEISVIEAIKIISHASKLPIPASTQTVNDLATDHWGTVYLKFFQQNKLLNFEVNDFNQLLNRAESVDLLIELISFLEV